MYTVCHARHVHQNNLGKTDLLYAGHLTFLFARVPAVLRTGIPLARLSVL
jgi:hypothetical protein